MSDPRRIGREYYDSSDYFDGRDARHIVDVDSRFQRYRVEKVLEIHAPQPGDRIVDLGCGWGTFSFALAARGCQVIGVDFSRRSIDFCEARRAALPPGQRERLSFLRADGGETGLNPDSYDLVLAADLFEHLYPEDSERVVREAYRLLTPGGRFSVWTPHRGHILEVLKNRGIILKPDITHVDYKSMDRMRSLLQEAGFEIEKAYYAESHVPILRRAERVLQRWVPILRRRIAILGRKPRTSEATRTDHPNQGSP
ncbi:MAG: class I SAM-dependent methyltransferase [Gemmatimonadota bacterium]|nr:class I SAM-dependent methyltransferase [Gemmatimonadota bacterium]